MHTNKLVIKRLTSFHRNFVGNCFGCGVFSPPSPSPTSSLVLLVQVRPVVRFLFCSVLVIRSCHHRALDPTLTSSLVDEMNRRVLHCIGSLDPLVIQYARTHNKHISSSSSAPTSPSPLFPCLSSLSSLWQMAAKHLNSCPHCHFNSLLSQVFCASHKYLSAVNVMNLIEPQSHPPPSSASPSSISCHLFFLPRHLLLI